MHRAQLRCNRVIRHVGRVHRQFGNLPARASDPPYLLLPNPHARRFISLAQLLRASPLAQPASATPRLPRAARPHWTTVRRPEAPPRLPPLPTPRQAVPLSTARADYSSPPPLRAAQPSHSLLSIFPREPTRPAAIAFLR